MSRKLTELYPDYSQFIAEIDNNGITANLLHKILRKHKENSEYNRKLYERYMGIDGAVPIFNRKPHYDDGERVNNKVNNDFFSEIVDFKTGYFAGKPIAYSYSNGEEAEKVTGGAKAVDQATKAVTDFVTRNNMYGVDMEVTKFASIYGYAGRLFYIEEGTGNERVMPVHGYETIILSNTNISEPKYAVRYFYTTDIIGNKTWTVEFYDDINIYTYKGGSLTHLSEESVKPHMFEYCPLQGVANNKELLGDAEKVLALIDDYDKVVSDNSNEIENFVHALMLTTLMGNDVEETLQEANKSGILNVPPVGSSAVTEPVKWITKNINDAFTEHHLQRLEDNIYRFSRTPNLSDEAFGTASGVSLKFKLHGLEAKCGMYEAQMMNAAQYMWKLLANVWEKKRIVVDPLQITMEFKRNFPLDVLAEAQAAQARIAAGLPKEWVFGQMADVDDVDAIMEMLEKEQEDITSMYETALEKATTPNNEDSAEETEEEI